VLAKNGGVRAAASIAVLGIEPRCSVMHDECPVVSVGVGDADGEPCQVGRSARELARGRLGDEQPAHVAATVALRRLQRAELIQACEAARGERVFRITARGRRELALQRDARTALPIGRAVRTIKTRYRGRAVATLGDSPD
jgi:hypothetical protein